MYTILIMLLLINVGCSNKVNNAIGEIQAIGENIEILILNKASYSKDTNPLGEVMTIGIDEKTIIVNEQNQNIPLNELKVGHKVKVSIIKMKSKNSVAEKIQLLNLEYGDVISSLLAPNEEYHVAYFLDRDDKQTHKGFEKLLLDYKHQNYTFSLQNIDPEYPYDVRQILNLEQLPAYLVLDHQDLIAKFYEENELREYISQLK